MANTPTGIDSALKDFRAKHPALTAGDLPTIIGVVTELAIESLAESSNTQYLRDPDNRVQIHPTFLVSTDEFTGSHHDPMYAPHVWRLDLSSFKDSSSSPQPAKQVYKFCSYCGDRAAVPHTWDECFKNPKRSSRTQPTE